MSNWDFIKIDTWWKAVLILGVLATASSFMFEINFIENSHLCGLGMGMVMIGIAFWIATKTASSIAFGGILSTKIIKHNVFSIVLLILGIAVLGLFLFLIVKGLI